MARYHTEQPFTGPAARAFEYLADFTTVAEWDPGIVESTRLDGGPLGVGSRFRVVSQSGSRRIPFVYEVVAYDPPRSITLVGDSRRLHSVDEITVRQGDGGSTVCYDADLTLRGPLRFLSPLLGLPFRKIGDRAAAGMRDALDRLEVS